MAIDVEDCKEIVRVRRKAGVNYMMMETAAYTREFLYIKKLKDEGKLGKSNFLEDPTCRIWKNGAIPGLAGLR